MSDRTAQQILDPTGTETESDVYGTDSMPGAAGNMSVLGPTLHFKGELSAEEDLLIQGTVEGSIHHDAEHLAIGSHGTVKADVHARHIRAQGQVEGDLYGTEAVVVEASARVLGNIYAPRVGLKEGARFKGSIDMDFDIESIAKKKPGAAPKAPAAAKPTGGSQSGTGGSTPTGSGI